MTRFGQILPLWPKNQSIWEFLRVYLVFGIFRTTLANYYAVRQIFIEMNRKIIFFANFNGVGQIYFVVNAIF